MTRDRTYFVKGQKVWEYIATGDLSYICLGKFRGRGRWIMGWVHVDPGKDYIYNRHKPDCRYIGKVEVSDEFFSFLNAKLNLICKSAGLSFISS